MAVSSTAATLSLNLPVIPSSTLQRNCFQSGLTFGPRQRRLPLPVIRSSGSSDVSAAGTTADTQVDKEFGEAEDSYIETPQGPPSLISALNVERALRGIPITDVDHYGALGVPRGCSLEQVTVAYKNKVEQLLNQGLDEEQVREKMELLKESYSILSSPEERRMYDWSLARSEKPDRYMWPFEVDEAKLPTDSPPQEEPEDTGPTRLVGYFIFGWLFLSFLLSIAFNR